MHSIYLWLYCLPICNVVILIFLASAAFFILKKIIGPKLWWKPAVTVILFVWFSALIWITVISREASSEHSANSLIPFHSYYVVLTGGEKELLRSNFMNVVLFYPAGLLACELLPKSWSRAKRIILVAVLFALVSVGIEFCQYHFGLGQAEVDDVIHNTLGALIGALVCTINLKWKPYKSKD